MGEGGGGVMDMHIMPHRSTVSVHPQEAAVCN